MALNQLLRKKKKKIPPTFVADVNEQPWQTAVRQGRATNLDAYSRLRGSSRFARQARKMNYQLAQQPQLPKSPAPTYVSPDQLAAGYFGVEPGATPTEFAKQQVNVARDRERLAGAPAFVATERRAAAQPLDIAREQQDLAKQAQIDAQILAERAQTEAELMGGAGRETGAFERGPVGSLESQADAMDVQALAAEQIGDTTTAAEFRNQAAALRNRAFQLRGGEAPALPATGEGGPFRPAPGLSIESGFGLEAQGQNIDRIVTNALKQSGLGRRLGTDYATGAPKTDFTGPLEDIGGDIGWPSEDTRTKMASFIQAVEQALSLAKDDNAKKIIRDLVFSDPEYSGVKKWLKTGTERFWAAPWRKEFSGEDFDTMESHAARLVQLIEGS